MSKKTQHTPGPWGLDADGDVIATGSPILVARVYRNSVLTTDEQEDANAHLIAAAPDLLNIAERIAAALAGNDNPVAAYEAKAEAFYRETGLVAPGKDSPAALHQTWEERAGRWNEWRDARDAKFRADLAAALKKARGE